MTGETRSMASDEFWETPQRDRPGVPKIPSYELIRRLGAGGFGEVWLGWNPVSEQYRAVKLFSQRAFIELRGLREFLRRVSEHPHLAPIEAVGQVDEVCYCIMPLADDAGGQTLMRPDHYEPMTLSRYLHRRGRMPLAEVVNLGRQMAGAIEHLHHRGAMHGDVKPGNILMLRRRWQLADHGLVMNIEVEGPRPCTPMYCPPEGPRGRADDLYALGVTLFELASGEEPRCLPEFLRGQLDLPGEAHLSSQLAAVLRKACAEAPEERYSIATDLVDALAFGGASVAAVSEPGESHSFSKPSGPSVAGGLVLHVRPARAAAEEGFRPGDCVRLLVESGREGFVSLGYLCPSGEVMSLIPRGHGPGRRVAAGERLVIPAATDSFELELLHGPGSHVFVAALTRDPDPVTSPMFDRIGRDGADGNVGRLGLTRPDILNVARVEIDVGS